MAEKGKTPGAQGEGTEKKAYDSSGNLDKEKLRENRKELGETPDGKTPEMDEGKKGTFP